MTKIEMEIECQDCEGTGIYVGMAEKEGAAVVCTKCKGSGKYLYKFKYNEFTGRKKRKDVNRVYLNGYGYVIIPHDIYFENIGRIDMSKEGVSYQEFLNGKIPKHIEKLACPMQADQGACHDIKGFTDKCNWGRLSNCEHQKTKEECWKRFKNK